MAKGKKEPPACYAIVQPGLETVAAAEIGQMLGGEVKRTTPGLVVFRVAEPDKALLRLRTTEDVFLLAWGTDQLTYRAADLVQIRKWTAHEPDWNQLLQIHHGIRPKPKGKPTFHLVTQMTGTHGYRRVDAAKALARGLAGKFPASWRQVDEEAAVEVWLTIHGATAVCGVRLSDRTMRHRTYKVEHLPASLRPTVAAAMVWLARPRPGELVLDPMCGTGTILAETWADAGRRRLDGVRVMGGDIDPAALRATAGNVRKLGGALLTRWDATRLPLAARSVDVIISNPPFGVQLSTPEEIGPLYRRLVRSYDRVLKPGGRAVLLVADSGELRAAARKAEWKSQQQLRVRVLGQPAAITVWRKGE